jgi:hypothetical protein
MVQGHIDELRAVVEQANDLPEETRAKLLQIAADLEREAAQTEGGDEAGDADETSEATDAEAPRGEGSSGLVSAIEGLEASHPEVTATVNNVARMLSKLGF